LKSALEFIKKKNPEEDIFCIGFSLGANIMTKYLGEEGENSIIKAAMGVCNPYSFQEN